jgi:hypothetical protein
VMYLEATGSRARKRPTAADPVNYVALTITEIATFCGISHGRCRTPLLTLKRGY